MPSRSRALVLLLLVVALATALPLVFTPDSILADSTGLTNPTSDQVSSGNCFELTPSSAYADDGAAGQNIDGAGDSHVYYNRIRYANLLRIIGEREIGDAVQQGEVFALVGQTGGTPVPRLRVELIDRSGTRLDPMALGERGTARAERVGAGIPEEQRQQFEDDIASWRRAMRKAAE